MARECSVCCHKKRREINAAIVASNAPAGPSLRQIAADFLLSPAAVLRHAKNHVVPAIRRAQSVQNLNTSVSKLTRNLTSETKQPDIQDLSEVADAIVAEANQAGGELLNRVNFLWDEAKLGLQDAKAPITLRKKNGDELLIEGGDLKARAAFVGQARKVAELGGYATGELRRDVSEAGRTVVVVLPPAGLPTAPRPLELEPGEIVDVVPIAGTIER